MCLEVTCDVGSTQHFATDVAGHFAFMPDHVGAKTVFGSKGRGTGLGWTDRRIMTLRLACYKIQYTLIEKTLNK